MGDVGIESTLVLDGLAVSKVRFYSTLDSDVGKRVEITDKFNPLNVFTGTFDASLNLLYDLPAFTSYQVKMYGLDGETVESDQTFMLKGYDYLEKNVGLNKNSFAGIKAIVDQGLENSMLEVGHTWVENDNADGGNHTVHWVITAINNSKIEPAYRHSVCISRKELLDGTYTFSDALVCGRLYRLKEYYNALPSGIKNALTARHQRFYSYNGVASDEGLQYVYTLAPSELAGPIVVRYGGSNAWGVAGQGNYEQHPYYVNAQNRVIKNYNGEHKSAWYNGMPRTDNASSQYGVSFNVSGEGYAQALGTPLCVAPSMMIASEPIE